MTRRKRRRERNRVWWDRESARLSKWDTIVGPTDLPFLVLLSPPTAHTLPRPPPSLSQREADTTT
eukprot:315737-Pyramimonas_sp.AAC.1